MTDILKLDHTDKLAQITKLALVQKQHEVTVARLEEELVKAKADLSLVAETEIPTLMDEVGMTEFTMSDGSKVKATKKTRGSINEERRLKAHAWLDEHGHGNLLTRQFIVDFDKEQEDQAKEFKAILEDSDDPLRYAQKNTIQWQTLDKFVTEQMEEGEDFPQKLFGVYVQRGTKITT